MFVDVVVKFEVMNLLCFIFEAKSQLPQYVR